MANANDFRFKVLKEPITDPLETQKLRANFMANFYSSDALLSLEARTNNYGVAISRKMWMDLTHIFFNDEDFVQKDGVMISFGYDSSTDDGNIPTRNLVLLLQALTTDKSTGTDMGSVNNRPFVKIDSNTLNSETYSTGDRTGGGGDGPGGNVQIPPPVTHT